MDNTLLHTFFEAYANRFNDALKGGDDVVATAAAFADYFVSANPSGVTGGKNDEAFTKQIPAGNDFYRNIGTTSMIIRSLDITWLDGLHAMVKVFWRSEYERKKDAAQVTIDFEGIYLLQVREGQPRIFAYITGDEQEVLRSHGII